jgi:hypothetical protein
MPGRDRAVQGLLASGAAFVRVLLVEETLVRGIVLDDRSLRLISIGSLRPRSTGRYSPIARNVGFGSRRGLAPQGAPASTSAAFPPTRILLVPLGDGRRRCRLDLHAAKIVGFLNPSGEPSFRSLRRFPGHGSSLPFGTASGTPPSAAFSTAAVFAPARFGCQAERFLNFLLGFRLRARPKQ